MAPNCASEWTERLLQIGLAVQQRLHQQLRSAASWDDLAISTGEMAGDRIYAIDRDVEELILHEISRWPLDCFPLLLIAEGCGESGQLYFAAPSLRPVEATASSASLKYRLIMDPIDGTRMLMYDKRSAWFLAAVAHDRGDQTSLADAFASVMVELPPSKQNLADCFAATRGHGTTGFRIDVAAADNNSANQRRVPIAVQPSPRMDLRDGFVSVVSYFPGLKVMAAELAEAIAAVDQQTGLAPNSFDDQYISTGGQLAQLMTGRDRCVIDLRPIWAQSDRCRGSVISAHPYDLAGLLVAQEAGVIVTDGFGQSLNAPFDVTSEVHWCGYANAAIQRLVEPIVQSHLHDELKVPGHE